VVRVPAGWKRLAGDERFVTWGSSDRVHTVTLAATDASVLPLVGVVAAVARDAERQLPGARAVSGVTPLELAGRHPRRDSAVVVNFQVEDPGNPALDARQVWRRDSRSGRDLVATWTSRDGRWPVDPGRAVPWSEVR